MDKERLRIAYVVISWMGTLAIISMQFFGTQKFRIIASYLESILAVMTCVFGVFVMVKCYHVLRRMRGRLNGMRIEVNFKLMLGFFTFVLGVFLLFLHSDWIISRSYEKIDLVKDNLWSIWEMGILTLLVLYCLDSVVDIEVICTERSSKGLSVPKFGEVAMVMGLLTEDQRIQIEDRQDKLREEMIFQHYGCRK